MTSSTKKSLQLGGNFWKRLGQKVAQWIREDAKKGIFQTPNGQSSKPTYNETYAKYKANDMRRFTTGEATKTYTDKKGNERGLFFDNKKTKTAIQRKTDSTFGTGKRLKSYYGQSIESRQTGFVDMTLTGQTLKGLHVKSSDENSVTLAYNSKDAGKIIGNQEKYDRALVGMNDKNIEKARQEVISEMRKKIDSIFPGDIKINIKF